MEGRCLRVVLLLLLNIFHSQQLQVKNKEFDEAITHNGKVYTFYYKKTEAYLDANNICMLKGGKLASVQDQQLQNKLQQAIKQQKPSCKMQTPFEKLIWIGADRSRDPNSWKWVKDGTVMNYTNWYREDRSESSVDNCVALATLNKTDEGEIFAKWFRRDCKQKYSFICENDYGSGYLDKKLHGAEMENIFRICVGFGDDNFRVVWKKSKCEVSTMSNQSVYQQNERDGNISISTIRTNTARKTEWAVYDCDIENKQSGKINRIGSITMEETVEKPRKYPSDSNPLRLIDSLSLVCESSGYPTPEISWTVQNKRVGPQTQTDTLTIHNTNNDNVLSVVSKLTILKPVALGPNAIVKCTARGRQKNRSAKFTLNSDLTDFRDDGFVVNVTSYSQHSAEEECKKYGGSLIIDSSKRGYHCKIKVAEMELDQTECPGKSLRVQLTDFSQSELVKMNLLLSRDSLMLKQKVVSNKTHDLHYEATYNHLHPGTNYQINLKYQPDYRTRIQVNLTKTFLAKAIPPGKVDVFEAYRTDEICRVCLDYPQNLTTRKSSKLLMKVKEIDENGTMKIENMRFEPWNEISFVMENPAATFSVRVENCAGKVGEETKFFPCLPDPHYRTSSSSVIIIAIVTSVIIAIVLIIGLLVCGTRKKKKSERGADIDFPLNLTTIAVDEDIRAHSQITDNSPYLTPNRHIPVHSSFAQPSEM